ncbi:MAG TPA: MBL fold metallo-hydrolase [Chthoniobacterales bacterium]|jgi:L-ascorbate metabolism protein UlaG (beta-lactamase superfamily)
MADSISPRRRSRSRRWFNHLWREWTSERARPIAPAFARPQPAGWDDSRLTLAWLGHSTVLINFFGVNILTDPVLFPRIGIRLPGFTIGPKRLTAAALEVSELPRIDLVLLSHAHFDHFDLRTLHRLASSAMVITANSTSDLLRWTRFREIRELRWNQETEIHYGHAALKVRAIRVQHWGARLRRDYFRGYNGYVLERNNRRIVFGGDTAQTDSFAQLNDGRRFDLAIMAIGAYDPWIRSHATPEQVVAMCNQAAVEYIVPVHHQTFRLSSEPFREPIERFEAALKNEPRRIALREIGQTFQLPG